LKILFCTDKGYLSDKGRLIACDADRNLSYLFEYYHKAGMQEFTDSQFCAGRSP
jgi:hypothetical protein